ncbi:MAG: hypothetical protein ACXAC2_11715 [Candidatus Kariarchaeaceae archaeon]|jgi:hypothetical protein
MKISHFTLLISGILILTSINSYQAKPQTITFHGEIIEFTEIVTFPIFQTYYEIDVWFEDPDVISPLIVHQTFSFFDFDLHSSFDHLKQVIINPVPTFLDFGDGNALYANGQAVVSFLNTGSGLIFPTTGSLKFIGGEGIYNGASGHFFIHFNEAAAHEILSSTVQGVIILP